MPGGVKPLLFQTAMDENYYERLLVDEIRALRADLRRYAVIAIGVFLGVSIFGFVLLQSRF